MVIRAVLLFLIYSATIHAVRNKRALVYPKGSTAKVQLIMGAGFPVDLRDETVIVGIVIKASYRLPQNSSFYTSSMYPPVIYARKKRSISAPKRWDVYKMIEQYGHMYGFGGKGCVLKAICDLADNPIDKSTGLIEELLHTVFTPSATNEIIMEHADNEYYAAEQIGKKFKGECGHFFPDCRTSLVDMFTVPFK